MKPHVTSWLDDIDSWIPSYEAAGQAGEVTSCQGHVILCANMLMFSRVIRLVFIHQLSSPTPQKVLELSRLPNHAAGCQSADQRTHTLTH